MHESTFQVEIDRVFFGDKLYAINIERRKKEREKKEKDKKREEKKKEERQKGHMRS